MSRNRPYNPFFKTINIPDPYFCDREAETEEIIKLVKNGNNLLLKSPRRLGKSSLIYHVFNQKEINQTYNLMYIDLFGTKNALDFAEEMLRAFKREQFTRSARLKKQLPNFLRTLALDISGALLSDPAWPPSPLAPPASIQFTIEEMFSFLEKTSKPNLVVFDEFQQIQFYPEAMAAKLRGIIQRLNNSRFIFSGSNRHLLTAMFNNVDEPFYKSTRIMDLDIIDRDVYWTFCSRLFISYGKTLTEQAFDTAYYTFFNSTMAMQELMSEVFANTPAKGVVDEADIYAAIRHLLFEKDKNYRELLDRMGNIKTRNTLRCIALLGLATGLTSTTVIRQYGLDNASSVQNALNTLTDETTGLVLRISDKYYRLLDKYLELWFVEKAGFLEQRVMNSRELFHRERTVSVPV